MLCAEKLNDEVSFISETDDDNYRPSKRTRADIRPPNTPRSMDDTDGMPSSPVRSQRGDSRDDVPMTDQTDDDPYDVYISLVSNLTYPRCYKHY